MKRNFNHITMILVLTFSYNISTLAASSSFTVKKSMRRIFEEEELTRKADAEIEDLLINSEIPTPTYKTPALWEVLIRKYGIKLLDSRFGTWLIQTYYNIKEAVSENSAKDEAA